MEVLTKIKKETLVTKNSDIVVLILNENKGYTILEKNMIDWVVEAVKNFTCVCADYKGEDILPFVNSFKFTHKYIMVLYDKIPMLTDRTVNKLVEYVVFKNSQACKFAGGYMFKNEYLKSVKNLFFDSVYFQDEEDFYLVENKRNLSFVSDVLQQRIINKHINNGVEFVHPKTVVVGPDVEIRKNVVIMKGNTLKGKTTILDNVILKENNIIENAIIENDVCVSSSTITNSKIGSGSFVLPYCHIEESVIGKNCTIKSGSSLIKQKIKNNTKS